MSLSLPNTPNGRLFYIDALRFLGLVCIVLAHVNPNELVFQARNFDVPLMVFLSGATFYSSSASSNYFAYCLKRFRRLVFPAWIFFGFYFLCLHVVGNGSSVELKTIARTFLLLDGVGYVWVLRVFFLVSLLSPVLYSLSAKPKSNSAFLGLVFILSLLVDFVSFYFRSVESVLLRYAGLVVPYAVGYGLVFVVGCRVALVGTLQRLALAGVFLAIFALYAAALAYRENEFVFTQAYKYPPGVYYISFALVVSILLYVLSSLYLLDSFSNRGLGRIVSFVGRNSMWFYLWHIPFVEGLPQSFFDNVGLRFLVVFVGAMVCLGFQTVFVSWVSSRTKNVRFRAALSIFYG